MGESRANLEQLIMRGVVSSMPEEEQKAVYECRGKLAAIVATYGDHGKVAFALLGTEICAED